MSNSTYPPSKSALTPPSNTIPSLSRSSYVSPRLWQATPTIPTSAGVYWFSAANGTILYVGKAKNLKNRLVNYRPHPQLHPKIKALVSEAVKVTIAQTASEYDALITEANLIRAYQPFYNSKTKDDKSAVYIGLTKALYPKIVIFRLGSKIAKKNTFSHQFGPYLNASDVKIILAHIRQAYPFCMDLNPKLKNKPCFYYHLKLCPGACAGLITPNAYRRHLSAIISLLEGKRLKLLLKLKTQIEAASHTLHFEKALSLKKIYDVLNHPPRLTTATLNDPIQLDEDAAIYHLRLLSLKLKNSLQLPSAYIFHRIECYDISHFGGKFSVAAMTVMLDGKLAPQEYRRFRIKTITGINDPGMLKETIMRRLQHQSWPYPQLIILDGGKSQLGTLLPLVPAHISLIGLTKKPDRLCLYHRNEKTYHYQILDYHHPADRLLATLRDEAHRFANAYRKILTANQSGQV